MRADWLPQVLVAAGLKVKVMAGAMTRGGELSSIHAVVAHHTASGPNWDDDAVAKLLRDGRPDLAGPLSQLGLQRDGTYVVVATGRANHNGYGTWGNDSIGIEAYNDGRGEPWPVAQLQAYDRGAAAILKKIGQPPSRLLAHRETDPNRKIDPTGIDMDAMRVRVARLMSPPKPKRKGPKMAALIVRQSNSKHALFECGDTLYVAHNGAVTTEGPKFVVNDDVWGDLIATHPVKD
jgi:hypothetical protein